MESWTVCRVVVDGLCLAAVGIPILVIKYSVSPTQRGFYCSDSSLYYPYHHSTITTAVNVSISYGVPIILIISWQIFNILRGHTSTRTALRTGYNNFTIFLFGVFTVQMVSAVCKVSAGRLRPHFQSVCQPSPGCESWERPDYLQNFTCRGNTDLFPDPAEMEDRLVEARLSFLSGHASLAWYGMVFSAGYLWLNSTTRERNILSLPVLLTQVLTVVYAVVVSISRVTDNKHHPTDVLAGAGLGLTIAAFALYRLGLVTKDSRTDYASVDIIQKSTSVSTNEEMLTKMT